MPTPLRVTLWNEYIHEQLVEQVRQIYPQGMHAVWAETLKKQLGNEVTIRTATLEEPEHGLTDEVLAQTDVLTWWGACGPRAGERRGGGAGAKTGLAGDGSGRIALGS